MYFPEFRLDIGFVCIVANIFISITTATCSLFSGIVVSGITCYAIKMVLIQWEDQEAKDVLLPTKDKIS